MGAVARSLTKGEPRAKLATSIQDSSNIPCQLRETQHVPRRRNSELAPTVFPTIAYLCVCTIQARFRVYGLVAPVFPSEPSAAFDLAHVFAGGRVVFTSDQHFGVGSNLVLPGRGGFS